MNVEVRQHRVELRNSLVDSIRRHIAADLGRFEHMIKRVCVRVADINGPRGGEDKSCRIQVHLKRSPSVIIEDRGVSVLAAIGRAVGRVDMAVSRSIDRLKGKGMRRAKTRASAHQLCTA
jgi:putative sigma-54 modulation protein